MAKLSRRGALITAMGALAALGPRAARAQAAAAGAWPERPMRWIVPFPPGGTTDILARLTAAEMEKALGQRFVIENRPGAAGTVGSDAAAKSPPDGYTLLMSNVAAHGVGPSLYARMPYDAVRDFTHIAMIAQIPSLLVINPRIPARTVAELVAWGRANPGKLRFASPGNGTSSHIKFEVFKRAAGIVAEHVPYRGSAAALTDVVAGHVEASFTAVANNEIMRGDSLRILGVTSSERVSVFAEVPTMRELGFTDLVAYTWFGISAPAGLAPAIADRLNAEMVKALATPQVSARFADFGVSPNRMTRQDFTAFVAEEVARWRPVVEASGARVQ